MPHRAPKLTVYEKPACTTCQELSALLVERGVDFETVDYHVDELSEEKIRSLLHKAGITAREALRMREPRAEQFSDASEDDIIAAMSEHPELLQRPIVEYGDRAVLARPVARVHELFSA